MRAKGRSHAVPIRVSIAYFYDSGYGDDIGDQGQTLGYLGILLPRAMIRARGKSAEKCRESPRTRTSRGTSHTRTEAIRTTISSATELLSKTTRDRNQFVPRDYRMLMATGPFTELPPESTLVLQVASRVR